MPAALLGRLSAARARYHVASPAPDKRGERGPKQKCGGDQQQRVEPARGWGAWQRRAVRLGHWLRLGFFHHRLQPRQLVAWALRGKSRQSPESCGFCGEGMTMAGWRRRNHQILPRVEREAMRPMLWLRLFVRSKSRDIGHRGQDERERVKASP